MTPYRSRSIVLPLVLVVLGVIAAGCASSQAPASTPANAIDMKQMSFHPASASVAVGTTVTWTNRDTVAHTVTPENNATWGTEGSGSDFAQWIQPGASWSFTFTKAGTYTYHCIPHSSKGSGGVHQGMIGTVIVT